MQLCDCKEVSWIILLINFLHCLFFLRQERPKRAFIPSVDRHCWGAASSTKGCLSESRPVIRIAPNAVDDYSDCFVRIFTDLAASFISTPTQLIQIFIRLARNSWKKFYHSFGVDLSTFGAINPKARRNILNKLFSRRSVLNIEPIIQEKVFSFALHVWLYWTWTLY